MHRGSRVDVSHLIAQGPYGHPRGQVFGDLGLSRPLDDGLQLGSHFSLAQPGQRPGRAFGLRPFTLHLGDVQRFYLRRVLDGQLRSSRLDLLKQLQATAEFLRHVGGPRRTKLTVNLFPLFQKPKRGYKRGRLLHGPRCAHLRVDLPMLGGQPCSRLQFDADRGSVRCDQKAPVMPMCSRQGLRQHADGAARMTFESTCRQAARCGKSGICVSQVLRRQRRRLSCFHSKLLPLR